MSKIGTGCFATFTLIALAWVCWGAILTSATAQQLAMTPAPRSPLISKAEAQQISQISAGITGGLGIGFFACTGLPAAMVCFILTLLCYSVWQSERRHQERMGIEQARNDILTGMAMTQLAQAQMQHTALQDQFGDRKESTHYWEPPRINPHN